MIDPITDRKPDHCVWTYTPAHGWAIEKLDTEPECMALYEILRRTRSPGTMAVAVRPVGWFPTGDVIAARLVKGLADPMPFAPLPDHARQPVERKGRAEPTRDNTRDPNPDPEPRPKPVKPSADLSRLASRILIYLRDHGPRTTLEIEAGSEMSEGEVRRAFRELEKARLIAGGTGVGGRWEWAAIGDDGRDRDRREVG